jgi:antitoxin HigA-1
MFVASAGQRAGSLAQVTAPHNPQWTYSDPRMHPFQRLRDGLLLCGRAQTATNEPLATRKLARVHPGEVLQMEFLEPLGLSQNRLALDIGVPARRSSEIVLRKRRVSADTALRLGRYFGTTPRFWLGLQTDVDIDVVADELRDRLDREVRTPTVRR